MSLHKTRTDENVIINANITGKTKDEWISSFGYEIVRLIGHAAGEVRLDPIELLAAVVETALLTLERDGLTEEAEELMLEINKIYDKLEAGRG